jgi:predicted PurR-regulated permease PerM
MTPEQIGTFLDRGIVVGLFVITFIYFIYKGIPALINLAKDAIYKINAEHTHQILMITQTFEKTLNTIATQFIDQIEVQHAESAKFHKEHGEKIDEIYSVINSTSLKSKKNAR